MKPNTINKTSIYQRYVVMIDECKSFLRCIITKILKTRILFVCLGNICRSPMAEGLFKHLIRTLHQELLNRFEVDSAGTAGYHIGSLPDHRMRATALSHGFELTSKARKITSADLDTYDFIIAMDRSNQGDIELLKRPPYKAKVMLMREFDTGIEFDVPDPYFGGMDGFEKVFDILEKNLSSFIKHLQMNDI